MSRDLELEAMRRNYLGMCRVALTRYSMTDPDMELHPDVKEDPEAALRWHEQNQDDRWAGKSWPMCAETMIGFRRLTQLENALDAVREEDIQGQFAECGVWRGGASIFAALYFATWGMERTAYAFDSFEGLPEGSIEADADSRWHEWNYIFSVSEDRVKRNAAAYGVPPRYFRTYKGWFSESLPRWCDVYPGTTLSILRVDADMWEGTYDALTHLYPRVSHGGLVIVDDYGAVSACRQAVDEYREENLIEEAMIPIDHTAVIWRKP